MVCSFRLALCMIDCGKKIKGLHAAEAAKFDS